MWAECKGEESTQTLAEHFTGLQHTLLNGRTINWGVDVFRPPDYDLGVDVSTVHVSCYGVRTVQDVIETTETGLHLYRHFKSGPDFCYVRVSWQPASLTMADLHEYVDEMSSHDERRLAVECVINEELYRKLAPTEWVREHSLG